MKTIICANYLKPLIINQVLNETKTDCLSDVQILPYTYFTYNQEDIEEDNDITTLKCFKLLNKNTDKFPLFGPMFKYPSFTKEITSFIKECYLYEVDFKTLPTDTPQQKELKDIITILADYPFAQKAYAQNFKDNQTFLNNLENKDVYPYFFNDVFNYRFFANQKTHTMVTAKSNSVKYALNPRQEIQAVAQDIVYNNKVNDTSIVLCDYEKQLPIVKQIFKLYNIPFSTVIDNQQAPIINDAINLITLHINKDLDSFIQAISSNAFNETFNKRNIDIIKRFNQNSDALFLDIKIPVLTTDLVNKHEYEILTNDINDTNTKLSIIRPFLTSVIKDDLSSFINNMYTMLADKYIDSDSKTLSRLKLTLEKLLPYLENDTDLLMLQEVLKDIRINNANLITPSVIITSLNRPVLTRNNVYVLGCSASNYPGFKAREGLFDENYVSMIDYPSLSERLEAYNQQLSWLDNNEKITYSYFTNNYEGKKQEHPFELNAYGNATKWDIDNIDNRDNTVHKIDSEIAKKLFVNNGRISGSISSFEKYFNCPYSYYLNYGLKVKKPYETLIANNTIGTIQHAILETAVNNFKKDYATISKDEMSQISKPYFDDLKVLYPNETNLLQIIEDKMLINLIENFKFLKDMEINTSCVPNTCEYTFSDETFEGIKLNGIIDRIDFLNDYLRIVDYKSSVHKLNENNIKSGLQLQLLTYLVVACNSFNKKPLAALYYSLKNEDLKLPAFAPTQKDVNETSVADEEPLFVNKHRLAGQIYNLSDLLDDSFNHIVGYSKTKNGVRCTLYDYDKCKECIETLYTYLHESLLNGVIDINPVKDGCKYCDYRTVCRFNGEGHAPTTIYPNSLVVGKSEEAS